MDTFDCLEALYSASEDGVTVDCVETEKHEFDDAGINITRVETPNNQLEVLVGDMSNGTVVEFDVKFSVDGSLMSIEMCRGDPREACGLVERVEVDES